MADTLGSVIADTLRRLGSTDEDPWTQGEIRGYVREGYDRLCATGGLLWDMAYLEDSETTANYTADFERTWFDAGDVVHVRFAYTSPVDREYVDEGDLDDGPTNHTSLVEIVYLTETYYRAVHDLPADLYSIERATWSWKRIDPLNSPELEDYDSRYQIDNGEVMGYLRDKDGLGRFRKWKIPAAAADEYTVTGTTGIARSVTDISGETVFGSWGLPRRVPGQHPIGGPWGLPRRFYQDGNNTRIEYIRRGRALEEDTDTFEIPARYVKYVRHYAQGRALDREGKGQDRKLAAIFLGLFDAGLDRIRRRKLALSNNRRLEFAGELREQKRPPLAKMPWQYGRVERW